jgi:hypothetical protein
MTGLTTDVFCSACRIFLRLAYPAGEATVPEKRRLYAHLPPGHDLGEYHAQHPFPTGNFQILTEPDGTPRVYVVRLGSAHYPHLKIKVHGKSDQGRRLWVFAVDTHDGFSQESRRPPPDHPDAEKWLELQRANANLKERVEQAWDAAGILTFNGLLRLPLTRPATDPP